MNEWQPNKGVMPVEGSVHVDVRFSCGEESRDYDADAWDWDVNVEYAYIIKEWRYSANMPSVKDIPESCVGNISVNPKEAFGKAKIATNLWPPLATAYGSLGLLNGGLKYGYGNYKATPVLASIYIAAAMRHLFAWMEGQEYDPADGVPNLAGVLANIAILLEARSVGSLVDDRQMTGGYVTELEELNAIASSLHEMYKDKKPRHYSIADNETEAFS